jgi:hypothetical protein
MLTPDDLDALRGVTVADAEVRERDGVQVLRLRLKGGGILAILAEEDGLSVADESAIP